MKLIKKQAMYNTFRFLLAEWQSKSKQEGSTRGAILHFPFVFLFTTLGAERH